MLFAPETGAEKPSGYVILTFWFLIGMFAFLYRKNIKLDLTEDYISYESSVLGFTLGYLKRPITEITEIKTEKRRLGEDSTTNVLLAVVGRKRVELNQGMPDEACQAQQEFFTPWLGLNSKTPIT